MSDQVDILTFAKSHPPNPGSYQQTAPPGGSLHDCMYYDCDVERAAEFLRDRYPQRVWRAVAPRRPEGDVYL